MSFCAARFQQRQLEAAYRSYVADSLMLAPQGKYVSQRFDDLARPHEDIDVDATIEHVITGLGLEVK